MFDSETDSDTEAEADTWTDSEGMPHVGVSPALCLCASVPLCLFSEQRTEDRGRRTEDGGQKTEDSRT
jgi:hypothetical protein